MVGPGMFKTRGSMKYDLTKTVDHSLFNHTSNLHGLESQVTKVIP